MNNARSARRRALSILLCALVTGASSAAQQAPSSRPAVPVEPTTAILDAFRSHDIVGLGEGAHGNEQGHAFRLSLIRDPRFSAIVNDIVVEFGNARYQDVMDRFVQGQDVPENVLRDVWQNTTQTTTVWERPIYEEFFRAVRALNAALPAERRLRVLLGDPPIDWSIVQTFEDVNKWMADGNRDRYPAELIRREVLAKKRRALVIYGEGHLVRMSRSIVQILESSATTRVFTIASPFSMATATDPKTLQADADSWRVPGLLNLRGTVLGAAAVTAYLPAPAMMREGKPAPADGRRAPAMEDQFDAVLYLGNPATITMSRLPAARCADASYIQMRLARIALMPPPLSKIQEDRLKQECALQAAK